ncbi:MAG TPA: hypothetical protein DCM22_04395, partial [Lachnospiraceae bacterium]|nr:hypothetical protein [Lachnospiraceae bacterium]
MYLIECANKQIPRRTRKSVCLGIVYFAHYQNFQSHPIPECRKGLRGTAVSLAKTSLIVKQSPFWRLKNFRQSEVSLCLKFFIRNIMMWVSKVPNYDAYGLFRALHSHNPPQYSHIVGLSSHFYAHIGAG